MQSNLRFLCEYGLDRRTSQWPSELIAPLGLQFVSILWRAMFLWSPLWTTPRLVHSSPATLSLRARNHYLRLWLNSLFPPNLGQGKTSPYYRRDWGSGGLRNQWVIRAGRVYTPEDLVDTEEWKEKGRCVAWRATKERKGLTKMKLRSSSRHSREVNTR